MDRLKIFKKGDIVIMVIIAIISLFPIVFLRREFKSGENSKIIITQDSKVIGVYELNKKNEPQYIDFEFVMNGETFKGRLETKKSKVRLLRLPEEIIPKSIHSDMSWISDDSKIIVALPAKLVVSIENLENESEVDAVST